MGERKHIPPSEVSDMIQDVEFWEEKNDAAKDAGIPVSNKRGEEGSVDPEFDEMDEDGRRNYR